jgi:hypothetical protein
MGIPKSGGVEFQNDSRPPNSNDKLNNNDKVSSFNWNPGPFSQYQ